MGNTILFNWTSVVDINVTLPPIEVLTPGTTYKIFCGIGGTFTFSGASLDSVSVRINGNATVSVNALPYDTITVTYFGVVQSNETWILNVVNGN
jgi:hypothetical protein